MQMGQSVLAHDQVPYSNSPTRKQLKELSHQLAHLECIAIVQVPGQLLDTDVNHRP